MQRSDKELKTQHDDETRKLEYVILMNRRGGSLRLPLLQLTPILFVPLSSAFDHEAARLERASTSKYENDGQKLKPDYRTRDDDDVPYVGHIPLVRSFLIFSRYVLVG